MKERRVKAAGRGRSSPESSRPRPPATSSAGLPARRTALEILVRVARDRAFADVLLGQRLDAFEPEDRRLVTQLALGTLAWQSRLDYELERMSSRKLESLPVEVLAILRLGLYQLRILTRIPAHAAVDTAVALTREVHVERAAGFVNAVLRNALRTEVPMPDAAADPIGYLAVSCSHPRWMAERFIAWFGAEAARSIMAANNLAAPNVLRLNLSRGASEVAAERAVRDGMVVARGGRFPETAVLAGAPIFEGQAWRDGWFQAQSEASQLVARLLAPATGATVVDIAAAPGGKATHLAELVGTSGKVVAIDLNFAGLRGARAVADRLGHTNLSFIRADASLALPLRPASVDYVLLDAPCSGLGTLREHPELRWRLSPSDIMRMADLQSRMLKRAAELLRMGGAMVYAVCSFAPAEGPELVRTFIEHNPGFEADRNPPASAELGGILDSDGFMRTRPDLGGLDGFFAVRLRRCA